MEGISVPALIDSGAQISMGTQGLCKEHGISIHLLDNSLQLEGMGGFGLPYLGFVAVNLRIPQIAKFDEDILLLVIHDSKCGNRVIIQIGNGNDR